jgi:3-hydroxyacyl-[acyl-carrier-protein] dehydratase
VTAVLDRALGRSATGSVWFAPDLPVLRGHFPGYPIVPGVFLVDAAEQHCRSAFPELADQRLVRVGHCRFRSPVLPGDTVAIRAELGSGDRGSVRCVLTVDDVVVAQLALTFSAEPVDAAAVAAVTDAAVPSAAGTDDAGLAVISPVDLRAILPHRRPILLVDRVDAITPGASIRAVKAVSANETAYDDRPTHAGYPWHLVLESWCQAAGVMMCWERPNPRVDTGEVMLFGGLSGVEFYHPARPGSILTHRVRLLRDAAGIAMVAGDCLVDGRLAMTVDMVSVALRPVSVLRPQVRGATR